MQIVPQSSQQSNQHRNLTSLGLSIFAAALLATPSAQASQSADLAVKGMIRPSACNIVLSGNGQVDYGLISSFEVVRQPGVVTALGTRNVTLSITCDVATRIGVKFIDNRAGTHDLISTIPNFGFGLGLAGDRKIGAYTIGLSSPSTGDKGSNTFLISADEGKTWTDKGARMLRNDGVVLLSWAEPGSKAPEAYRTISQPLRIDTYLAKPSDLPPLDAAIKLDGSATVALVYL